MLALTIVFCQASLFIIFVWRYDLRKPCFIIVLWTLIVIMILLAISHAQMTFQYNHLNYSTHSEEKNRLLSLVYLVEYTNQRLLAIAHWIFAIMYFKLALKLWILSRSVNEEHLKKQSKCLT